MAAFIREGIRATKLERNMTAFTTYQIARTNKEGLLGMRGGVNDARLSSEMDLVFMRNDPGRDGPFEASSEGQTFFAIKFFCVQLQTVIKNSARAK